MSRGVWIVRNGELIPKHLAPPLHPRFGEGPMVIGDGLPDVLNPVNGKIYDSKHAYERAVRDAGCHILGGEMPSASKRKAMSDPGPAIKDALDRIEARAPVHRRKKRGYS